MSDILPFSLTCACFVLFVCCLIVFFYTVCIVCYFVLNKWTMMTITMIITTNKKCIAMTDYLLRPNRCYISLLFRVVAFALSHSYSNPRTASLGRCYIDVIVT